MFQNINANVISDDSLNKNKKMASSKLNIVKNMFMKKYFAIYIVSFMISMVGISDGVSPFSLSVLAACFANSIPVAGVIIVSLIGTFIKAGIGGVAQYLIIAIVLIASFFIVKIKYNEDDQNENIKIGKNIFVATLLVLLVQNFMAVVTVYDILTSIVIAMITYIFYKIFVNSLCVLEDFARSKAFSIEEVIGTSLLVAISVSCLGDLSVAGIVIKNVLSIFIVLLLGWKNGILIGTTVGVTVGVTLGVISGTEVAMIAAYAISGMIAGALNRFGRIGVIVGFVLGTIVLTYISNGYTIELIHFKEILIASLGLLLVPKNVNINIKDFMDSSRLLPIFPSRALNKSKETADNLSKVSKAIHDMAETYKQTEKISFEDDGLKQRNKQLFITELLDNMEPYKDNLLYDDLTNVDGKILEYIFDYLLDVQEIDKEELVEIFAKCNSYIIGFDDNEISKTLENNLNQVVRAINGAYKVCKSDFVWQKIIEQNNKNTSKQLNNVSKAIDNIANDLKDDIIKDDEYKELKLEIINLLDRQSIKIEDINIKKKNRFFVDIYVDEDLTPDQNKIVEKVLTQVLKEKIVLNKEDMMANKINYISADKYVFGFATAIGTKSKSSESGDSIISERLKDGNYLVALSDGMGSGTEAKKSSMETLAMLLNLLSSGFDKEISIDMINTTLLNKKDIVYATLDIAIVDLYLGKIEFLKSGACPSYIKNGKKVQIVKANSLPVGITEEEKLSVYDKDINDNDIIVLCSDGVLDSNIEYKNKELWIKYMLEDITVNNTKKIADLILNEAIDNNFGRPRDDLSVIVCKLKKGVN